MMTILLLDGLRGVLPLLHHLDEALASIQLPLRGRVEVGAELREGRHLAVTAPVRGGAVAATFFIAFTCALPPTRDTECRRHRRPTPE